MIWLLMAACVLAQTADTDAETVVVGPVLSAAEDDAAAPDGVPAEAPAAEACDTTPVQAQQTSAQMGHLVAALRWRFPEHAETVEAERVAREEEEVEEDTPTEDSGAPPLELEPER